MSFHAYNNSILLDDAMHSGRLTRHRATLSQTHHIPQSLDTTEAEAEEKIPPKIGLHASHQSLCMYVCNDYMRP